MSKINVDFSSVEDSVQVKPGKYLAVVKSISMGEGAKAKYLKWALQVTTNPCKGLHINHITSLSPNALFMLRDTLTAIGVKVPKAAVAIDPDKFIGKTLGIDVGIRPYEGKEYANVTSVFSPAVMAPSAPEAPVDLGGDDDIPFKLGGSDEIVLEL